MRAPWTLFVVCGLGMGLLAWATWPYAGYVGVAIAVLSAAVVANQPRIRRQRERENRLIDIAFQDAYSQLSLPPSIVRSHSYGYPAFEIKFRSRAEREAAAAMNEAFKAEIGRIFKDCGSRFNPFNAERAVSFSYEGERFAGGSVVSSK